MKAYYFIAKRILKSDKSDFSNNIVKIGIGTITVGVIVMLLSVFIVRGFKYEIEHKITGFTGNLRITSVNINESPEFNAIKIDSSIINQILSLKEVKAINSFANKLGILKTNENLEGVVFKGIDSDYCQECFSGEIIDGEFPIYNFDSTSNNILISKIQANKLEIKVGDRVDAYFLHGETPRVRKYFVKGIYESGFTDFDQMFVLLDIKSIRSLNEWTDNQNSGYEIFLNSPSQTQNVYSKISPLLPFDSAIESVYDINYQIFDWLNLQDVNVIVLLTVMSIVCVITILSVLVIIIVERTSMIGILKSLGMNNRNIRKIFLLKASYIVILGIILGNAIALLLSAIQLRWSVFSLPAESYYMSKVPIKIDFFEILLIDFFIFVICMVIVYFATTISAKIKPTKAIKYD
ncbi:MAG: ABC transporter permease [Bacteroidales bacterium]